MHRVLCARHLVKSLCTFSRSFFYAWAWTLSCIEKSVWETRFSKLGFLLMTMVYIKKQYDYFAIKKSYTTSLFSLGLDIWTRNSKINKFKISNPMDTSSWNRHRFDIEIPRGKLVEIISILKDESTWKLWHRFDVEISTWIPFSKSTKYRWVLHMGFSMSSNRCNFCTRCFHCIIS